MDEKIEKVVVRYKNYFELHSDSEEIDFDKIDVEINTESKKHKTEQNNLEPDFLSLAILWAHFQACREGKLGEGTLAPWERIDKENQYPEKEWLLFLNDILDNNLLEWFQAPEKIKQKSIRAYKQLKSKDSKDDLPLIMLRKKIKHIIQKKLENFSSE